MSDFNRRQFLKGILGTLVQAAGAVVVATAAASEARAEADQSEGNDTPPEELQQRADRLAATSDVHAADAALEFLNGGFRNTPLGGFRNSPLGRFRNTPIGAFRNTPVNAFRNTPLGAFGNG